MKRTLLTAAALLASLLHQSHAATITIVNLDGAGEGFNDPTVVAAEGGNAGATRGQQRLNVFQTAASIWGAQLQSNIAIKVGANFDSISPCSTSGGVLGFAGPGTFSTLSPTPVGYFSSTWYAIAEAEAVRDVNLNGANNEISATFNSDVDTGCLGAGTRFWYGIDSTPVPSNRIALLPTLLHELGHGLGFLTVVDTSTGALGGGLPDVWTYFLKNAQTGELWKDMTNAERAASAIDDPDLIWDGPAVTASIPTYQPTNAGVNGATGRMRMYAPSPLEPGSSVSHWTDDAASPNLLMEPAINSNLFSQTDMTVPLFQDIGWPLAAGGSTITIADRTSGEATTPMQFTLTRSSSTGTATVVASTAPDTATGGGTDYSNVSSQTVTFGAGSTTATLNVTINNDTIDEIDETFFVNLSSPSAGYSITDAQAIGTITDNDTSSLSVNDPAAVTEGSSISFTVSMSNANSRTVTVTRATANGTANSSDYTSLSAATLTFNAGETSKTVIVNTTDDALDEPSPETFTLNLSGVNSAAVIGDASGTGSINDNEPTPTISVADAAPQAEDNGNSLRYVISLSGPSQSTITVRADTANGTATAPSDYQARANVTVTFSPGITSQNFDVTKVVDAVIEPDETVLVNLSNASAGASILDGSATGTIVNDDGTEAPIFADGFE